MNKVVYVNSNFKPVGKYFAVDIPTGEKKKGMFGGEKEITKTEKQWKQTGWSDCEIDGTRLARDIQSAIEQLNADGYFVVNVTPITSGQYNYEYEQNGSNGYDSSCMGGGYGYGYGYGFSITEGVIVIGQKMELKSGRISRVAL